MISKKTIRQHIAQYRAEIADVKRAWREEVKHVAAQYAPRLKDADKYRRYDLRGDMAEELGAIGERYYYQVLDLKARIEALQQLLQEAQA